MNKFFSYVVTQADNKPMLEIGYKPVGTKFRQGNNPKQLQAYITYSIAVSKKYDELFARHK